MNPFIALFVSAFLSGCAYGQTKFTELSIQEAVELGLKNNPEIKSAQHSVSAAEGRFRSGISLPKPEVGVSYEYAPVQSSLSNFGERTFEIRQTLEFPSVYFQKARLLSKSEGIAVSMLRAIERKIIYRIKTSYCRALLRQSQLRYARENLLLSEQFLKKAEVRTSVGEGTNLEKLTAKVQGLEAQNKLEDAKNELSAAHAELNFALGLETQTVDSLVVLTDSLYFTGKTMHFENIDTAYEKENPQLQIAALQNDLASAELDLARSSYFPAISLGYFRQTRDGSNGYYGASFGVSIPLWFMFEQTGKISEAAANYSAAEDGLTASLNETRLHLRSACADYQNSLRHVLLYRGTLVPQAEEVFSTAEKSYAAGEVSYLEFLQARQMLAGTRNNYINALFDHSVSVFRIEEIAGDQIFKNAEMEK